jgi:predicted unusual protein kinase regulating ubiquinone biosynthesis (AarF/ABC1/UbiB family)
MARLASCSLLQDVLPGIVAARPPETMPDSKARRTCTLLVDNVSHCDLNSGNVLYDSSKSKLSFIDFAEANYSFIYRDIFSPLQIELGICRPVYQRYYQLHDKLKYSMPTPNNSTLRNIMKYRLMFVLLRRFIKASDDLRTTPQSNQGITNNANKIAFMREQIAAIKNIERQLSK